MENFKTNYKSESDNQSGLNLRLAYMVEDYMELIKNEEKEKMAVKKD